MQGWARAFADPVEVGVLRHAEGAVCVLAFSWGFMVYSEYREPSTFHSVMSFIMVDGASGVGLLWQFPYAFEHGKGEATYVLFVG